MKALVFRETGEPKSVLQLAEIPSTQLAPGEALVRMLLSPMHPSDLHMGPNCRPVWALKVWGFVEALGPGVQGPAVGTRVVFAHLWL